MEEEISFVKDYIFMLQIRFESNLECTWNIPQASFHSPIPPLTLQLLVENAVKHNAITSDEKLLIEISINDQENLVVKNNRTRTPANQDSFGVGLENIRQRYAFFSKQNMKISDNQDFYCSTTSITIISSHMKKILFNQPIFRLIGPAIAGFMIYILILLIFDRIAAINENFNLYELSFLHSTWLCMV